MIRDSEVRSRYAAMLQADAGAAEADEREESIALVNSALQSIAAADVGWIRVTDLPSFVQIAATTVYRPGQQLRLVSARFDSGDPFLDLTQPSTVRRQLSRIEAIGALESGLPGVIHLQLAGPDDVPENLIGTPLVQGEQIAGMIVFQSEQDSRKLEAVTGQTLQLAVDTIEKQ
jgi:hypothetical protein